MTSGWVKGASLLVGAWGDFRSRLYRDELLKPVRVPVPVLSVGNLTVGGTGKTPVTRALARLFSGTHKVGIISRNYKAEVGDFSPVDPAHPFGARHFGDEPFLLANSLDGVPVFVGPSKSDSARRAHALRPDLNLFVVDDGFQHQALHRDFDLVLLDATDPDFDEPFPVGRGRERVTALERADWILLTKVNWSDEDLVRRIRERVPPEIPLSGCAFETRWPEIPEGVPIGIFAGIARPEVFIDLAHRRYPGRVRQTWGFRDHQKYGEPELRKLEGFLRGHPDGVLLTTEKDAVKIEDPVLRARLRVVGLEVSFEREGELLEKLRSRLR